MQLPFTPDQFLGVFAAYNRALWPAPIILMVIAAVVVVAATLDGRGGDRIVCAGLAILLLWSGSAYHWAFFTRINPAATAFGALFVVEGALLVAAAAWPERLLSFRPRMGARGAAGAAFMAYALAGYPLAAMASGHTYPAVPTFGTPCPTIIFLFGMLLWSAPDTRRVRLWAVLAVPLLWAVVGTVAAVQFGMREDLALPLAALVTVALLLVPWRAHHSEQRGAPAPRGESATPG